MTGGHGKPIFDRAISDITSQLLAGAKQLRLNWSDLFPLDPSVDSATSTGFTAARAWAAPRRDPLILDLNGNGIETVAPNLANPILFDHNGNGIKTGTGWVAATDGFLVLDRNGNGTIDNGTEMFGDSTQLAAGGNAADGFAALAGQDSNADGVVNALDANFASLKVWQDLNQDGISQAGELKTLAELGIASLNLAKTANSQTLTGGNQIADLGSFTRTDGTTAVMADVNLASDTFHRSFTDIIPVTALTAALPDMQGSGRVRDLRQAASLTTVEGTTLAGALGQFAATTTRADQRARLDALLADWAATSNFQTSIEKASAQNGQLLYLVPGLSRTDVPGAGFARIMALGASGSSGSGGGGTATVAVMPTPVELAHIEMLKAQQIRITQLIGILEKFNGTTFVSVEAAGVRTGINQFIAALSVSSSPVGATINAFSTYYDEFVLNLSGAQITLIESAYASLRQSVYDGLLMQTRLKPYLDNISLTLGSTGVALDFTALNARLAATHAANANTAIGDLLDLQKLMGSTLEASGWNGAALIRDWASTDLADAAVVATLTEFGYLVGGAGDDILNGGAGNDQMLGGAGNDTLNGDAGNDTLDGGAGNDILNGGAGADTYYFNRGNASDTIVESGSGYDYYYTGGNADRLIFGAGITAADLSLSRVGQNLVMDLGAGDRLTFTDWFKADASYGVMASQVDNFQFSDGTVLTAAALINSKLVDVTGTAGDDILSGGAENNRLIGDSGNDTLNAGAGNDTLLGGAGNDTLNGDAGNDTLDGGEGNNILNGGDGSDSLTSGSGNDILNGGAGADTYYFNRGNASDTIVESGSGYDYYYTGGNADRLIFGAGITAADLSLSRVGQNLVMDLGAGDRLTFTDWFKADASYGVMASQVDNFQFADGTVLTAAALINSKAVMTVGTDGNDVFSGSSCNDILQGAGGNDVLSDAGGRNLFNGGAGMDVLTGSVSSEMFVGGTGNDIITTGTGADIIVFNRGDGMDVVNGGIGTDNTVSLGRGIAYADIALSKVNNDLVLEVCPSTSSGQAGDQITFANWYDTTANNKSVLDLQVMTDAMAGFDATSTDPLLNQAVQNFDFTAIANAFDQARGTSATFMHWSATNSLLAAHLSGSDTAALGGDLAHQYGTTGSFTGMNLTAAQDVLNAPQFGAQAQALRPLQGLQGGGVTLQ